MESEPGTAEIGGNQYFKKRLNSSRRDKGKQTLLPSQRSARGVRKRGGKRTIQMRPESIFEKPRPKTKLVPTYEGTRNTKGSLNKILSEQKLPGIRTPAYSQQTSHNVLPPMKKSLTRRTLAGSSLQRVYSNPQFTKLNQDPYFRPKTSAFGFSHTGNPKKDPTKKAPWTSEPVKSITGIKTMTSLAPGNALLKKDKNESSPAKRSLSRKAKRKKTGVQTQRNTMYGTMYNKRPKTSYLLQSAAEKMPWPKNPDGRSKLDPMTPVKVFSFKGDVESQFLHSEKDFKMTYEDSMHGKVPEMMIEEEEEFSREEEKYELTSAYSGHMPEQPKKKIFNRSKKPSIKDVIRLLQNEPKETGQYFYCIRPDGAGPYDLQPLLELDDHQKLDKIEKSYTLSSKGITTYYKNEPMEFITLNDWLADRDNYEKIRQKTFFQKFDRWKILRIWKSRINVKKRETVTEKLTDKLFILHKHFRPVLLGLKERCNEMENFNFIEITDSHEAISKEVFSQKQEAKRTRVKELIEKYSKSSRDEFRDGIKNVLDELKANLHEGNDTDESIKKKEDTDQWGQGGKKGYQMSRRGDMKTSESDRVFEDLGFKPNLKFGAKSSLRRECSRFLRCAYLLDFITMDCLTNIYLNSVKLLFDKLDYLSDVPITYEFDATKSQFGESKKIYVHTPEPMFKIEAIFHEDTIHPSDLIEKKMKRFEPLSGSGTSVEFDPIVHLELEDPNQEVDEEIDHLEDTDEESTMVTKLVCPKIYEIWIKLDPNKNSFIDLLEESISQGYASIKSIERWSRHGELLKYVNVLESWDDKVCESWDPPDDNYLDCTSWLDDEVLMRDRSQIIRDHVNQAFGKIERYLMNFQPFLQKYYDNKNLNFDIILHPDLKNPLEVLPELLKMLNAQSDDFDNYLPEGKDLGLLKVNFHKVKSQLKPNPKKIFERIKKELPAVIRMRLNQEKQWLIDQIDSISSPAIKVDEYVRQVQALNYIENEFQNVKDRIDLYQNIHRICSQNGIEVSKDDAKLLREVFSFNSSLTQEVMDSTESIGNKKKTNIESIKKQLPIFEEEVKKFQKTMQQDKFFDINSSVEQMKSEMKKFNKEFMAISEKASTYKVYQKTLEMETSQFADVEAVRKHVECLTNLWNALSDWTRMVDGWKGDPFIDINTEEISKEAEKYTKIVMRCQKGLREDSTAVLHLKKQVFDFKDTMPIVTALGNKNYTEAHWNEIKELTNIDIELEKLEFCLGELIDEEIAIHQEAIQEISTKATQEAKLISELEELKEQWSSLELVVKPYKEVYPVISEVEELQLDLDDMMTNINNILGNRYVATLRSKATILFHNLSSFLEIFDQWKECQRNWTYLENIFVSDDIKQQTKTDYNEFEKVNKKYTDLMKSVNKNPRVSKYCEKFYFNELKSNNEKMDKIQKNLEAFLESKRQDFPRFFFLSNEELLQILAAAQDIKKVEKHLNKIFENIMKLELGQGNASNQIHKMISGEGEEVEFTSSVKIKTEDKIETTLKNIEDKMIETIKKKINATHSGYNFENPERDQWVLKEIGQVITTVSQIIWTDITENYIVAMQETKNEALDDLKEMIVGQLDELTVLVRGKLEKVKRKILISLITADVHNRDIVNDLAKARVNSIDNFEWLKQLRYYNEEGEPCYVKQVNATLTYGYEYMGAASRLVITPLTDRCWMTITGALHIKLGAAPAGPAGTGKTESTKDLSKALGIQCVVFNCSDQIEYKMMARLFSGLISQGAWACLDEFNRIEEEVLSVIAQQLLTIKFALLKEEKEFEFNNSTLKVNPMCGVFVTMNPGYEGRTELPDNLAVLFRPVAMMIPNYGQIAEIMLYAEGFKDASNLSKKMVQLYKLASEQLSQQKHYDFGMRAVKSVLVMAGALKRENTNLSENVVLIRAMRDSNIPKFLSDDLPLFKALIQDLFPKVEIPEVDYGELQTQIVQVIKEKKLEPKPEFITKAIQLFDTFNVRFGVMIVGPTGGGKTTCYDVLAKAMTELRENDSKDNRFQKVNCTTLNPKSISMGELYGEENPATKEWTDGLASKILRENATVEGEERSWCIFDGPVDALWIENMNTVLDDNMALCLSNGERIKLKPTMRILFEVQDLEVASPATVSRCGMVYMTPSELGWAPYVNSWIKRMFSERKDVEKPCLNEEAQIFLRELFDSFVDETFEIMNNYRNHEPIQTFEIQSIICVCNFLENFINEEVGGFHYEDTANEFRQKLIKFFAFSFIWGMGGSFDVKGSCKIDQIVRRFFHNILPSHDTVFDYGINLELMKFEEWKIPSFEYDPSCPFFSILVPTIDTVRYSYLLNICIKNKKPVFFTGETGVGKSVIIQKFLSLQKENMELSPINLNFSAQTDSLSTQQTIEANLIKKKGKSVLGANGNNTCVLFIDDVNMPSVEKYGAQPPIELLRQIIGGNVFYDRAQLFKKRIENFVTICSAAPPSGGRATLTPRFTRFFHVLCLPQPSEETMKSIFEGIIDGFFRSSNFMPKVSDCGRALVESTVLLYNLVTAEFLPTPSKFHYTFNLRDISKVFQGILMVKPISIENEASVARLWIHEVSRVFYDRLVDDKGREMFIEFIETSMRLKNKSDISFTNVRFSNLLKLEDQDKLYEEIVEDDHGNSPLINTLNQYLDEFNIVSPNKMNLVFFSDAVDHICRIVRVLLQPRGNAMLVGVSGCGKQSLTKLASFMLSYKNYSIKLTKNYKPKDFREDLREVLMDSGCTGAPYTFLMSDTQIINETFLEDINNILNTGDITNLYDQDSEMKILDEIEPYTKKLGRPTSNDVKYATYIERLRDQFHIILCMSPVGDSLRIRCRMFPSLVNCCTLDWYDSWSEEALLSVSKEYIKEIDGIEQDVKEKLSQMCPFIYKSVEKTAVEFDQELRRKVYITPKSYLDSISMYKNYLDEKRKELDVTIDRLSSGLSKLKSTNEQVAQLEQDLTEFKPQLQEASESAQKSAQIVKEKKKEGEKVERDAEKDANEVAIIAEEVKIQKDEVDAQLEKARPAMEKAEAALDVLDPADIDEVKRFPCPPSIVMLVLECVLTYFKEPKKDWDVAKKVMGDKGFFERLRKFEAEKCTQGTLNKVRKIINKKDFDPKIIEGKAKAAACLASWCIALERYAEIRKNVKPMEEKLMKIELEYDEANQKLLKSNAALKEARDKVQAYETKYNETIDEITRLNDGIKENEIKLKRASQLINLTKEEGENWKETVAVLNGDKEKLIGDVFLGTSSISYIGPFTGVYREKILSQWIEKLVEFGIPQSEKYKLTNTLGDAVKVRNWNMAGLPSDSVSIDNGIMCDRSERWPLLIDPQTQANQWIRNSFSEELKIVKLSETDTYPKVVDTALRLGNIVLIEDVLEEIDPALDNILQKAIFDNNGLPTIHFGGKDVTYDDHFKLFMTSKLPNPHYLPEICIKMTIINFTVTFEGLEEQMLVDVVVQEKPLVEEKRDELIIKLAKLENDKRDVEIKILKTLADSNEETILNGDELISILQTSKEKAGFIKEKLKENIEIEAEITETRNQYKQVSIRGSILYFVITDLAIIDPMYQYSLTYVKKLFNDAIRESKGPDDLDERIEVLIKNITKSIYNNICRGLFENHKMIYSFLICTSIEKNRGDIDAAVWNFLLRGAGIYDDSEQPDNPLPSFIKNEDWDLAYAFEQEYPSKLEGLCESMRLEPQHWVKFAQSDDPTEAWIPCTFNEKLDSFEKLIILKIFRPESLSIAFTKYVSEKLGSYYSESPPSTMEGLYADSDKETPVIFVLSQGADPTNQLVKFAESKNYLDKFKYISLGQGQDKVASRLIEEGKKDGYWILLQNCHLFKSWMLELENIVNGFAEDSDINPKFRLFLTSMPVNYFPVSVLQNGLKLTTEPPKGIKANMKRSYNELTENDFAHGKPEWNRLLFGLCFFHAIVQERRKFGPLGWNIRYQFNESDLETSRIMLSNFLNENETTPWDSMTFMTGQINYGGRVTDDLDRKLLLCILSKYYTPDILEDGYRFSESGIYYAPHLKSLREYREYIDTLPPNDDPEVFGMHENANLSFKINESASILAIILDIQPRMSGGGEGMSGDDIILGSILDFQDRLPDLIDINDCAKHLFKEDQDGLKHCLATVLLQEIEKFNNLLSVMESSLISLCNAIQGKEIMSQELDEMYGAFLKNQVPPNWVAVAYPSLKPLASWILDLLKRVEFMRVWCQEGHPKCFWLPGFFFPHGFMTGTLQTYARRHKVAVDLLQYSFEVLKIIDPEDVHKAPEDGIYVNGLFIEAAKWNLDRGVLEDQVASQSAQNALPMPIIYFCPKKDYNRNVDDYSCPVYKTSVRAGVLNTTGQSTNFVLAIDLPTSEEYPPDFWVLRGTALLF